MTQTEDTPVRGPGRPATGNAKSRADAAQQLHRCRAGSLERQCGSDVPGCPLRCRTGSSESLDV